MSAIGHLRPRVMAVALAFSAVGAALKLYGGLHYSSRAVLVDGLTCVANLASGAVVLSFMARSSKPPDEDHPYGHGRQVYVGSLAVVVIYVFVAGLSAGMLVWGGPSAGVGLESAYYALAGGAFYAASIALATASGPGGSSYAAFTLSEVLESAASAASAYAGARLSTIYDLAGAAAIAAYIIVEAYREARGLAWLLADYTPPQAYRMVLRILGERGFAVRSLRVRPLLPGLYVGDARVRVNAPPDVAFVMAEEASAELRRRGVELAIQVEGTGNPGEPGDAVANA